MGIRPTLWLGEVLLAIPMISSSAGAQDHQRSGGTAQTALDYENGAGIRTDRLRKSQLKTWKSIMEIVLARDKEGRPFHPILYGLYHQADISGHEVQIELSTQRATMCAVGVCSIEAYAESTQKAVVLIRLNLGMIDRAMASERSRRADGFIPFAGLKKKQRYAEVLGHELAHVVQLLTNPGYRGLYLERQALADAGSQDIRVIGRLTSLIEKPAEAAEIEIWHELIAGREPKMSSIHFPSQ
jgi:hypothetical protein